MARTAGRPTLAVSITTRDSGDRLAGVIAHARAFADEVLVGVDEASSDDTLAVAAAHADRVVRFRHTAEPSPARTLAHERASTDWVLELDDDEAMDAMFPVVLPELLASTTHNHWWLPRKWLVPGELAEYIAGPPWFPDWQLRLVRADPTIIWKPVGAHTGRRVVGRAGYEARAAILHLERLQLSEAQRAAKLASYRARGAGAVAEDFYGALEGVATRRLEHGAVPALPLGPSAHGTIVEGEVIDLDRLPRTAPWGGALTVVEAPAAAVAGSVVTVRVNARNTGGLRWSTHDGVPQQWPIINLVCRLIGPDGLPQDAGAQRFATPSDTRPGESVQFLCAVQVPEACGAVVLQWELVSENELWFAARGSVPATMPLQVVPGPG